MQERLEARLRALRDEFQSGQKMLADLDARRQDLEQTLLRISGAIQVLEELLGEPAQPPHADGGEPALPPADGTAVAATS
jgi:hypothetical protein